MTLEALERLGGVEYLEALGRNEPAVFGGLLRRCIPQAVEAKFEHEGTVQVIDLSDSTPPREEQDPLPAGLPPGPREWEEARKEPEPEEAAGADSPDPDQESPGTVPEVSPTSGSIQRPWEDDGGSCQEIAEE